MQRNPTEQNVIDTGDFCGVDSQIASDASASTAQINFCAAPWNRRRKKTSTNLIFKHFTRIYIGPPYNNIRSTIWLRALKKFQRKQQHLGAQSPLSEKARRFQVTRQGLSRNYAFPSIAPHSRPACPKALPEQRNNSQKNSKNEREPTC